ncbi:hypothetical protein JQ608_06730 [Bradyrhizobium liaoningense]|uniref:hypothetical protein n=1 Tax=Bradyrhizobium liaoningense TaxID=43992 RepID=UPI001BA7B854|nr:hypothetical protein [Bradyrhizobium liaoningense]MBR0876896.1 hypothetical protein [Bradyrhizobium liaoningense]
MSDKLKMSHADRITDERRDAVLAAAIEFVKNPAAPDVLGLRKAVESYQAFASSVDPGEGCAVSSCGAPDVCKRHWHCFYRDNDARGD